MEIDKLKNRDRTILLGQICETPRIQAAIYSTEKEALTCVFEQLQVS